MKILGLIGNPVSHSRSPEIFQHFFTSENLKDYEYRLFPLKSIEELPDLIRSMPDLLGFNVTIPFKKSIVPLVNKLHISAEKTGAINTVKIHRESDDLQLEGFNTDVYGFKRSLEETFPVLPGTALIFGTGGSSEAVAFVLDGLGIQWKKVSRSGHFLPYSAIDNNILAEYKLLINCTPMGMALMAEDAPPIPYAFIGTEHICFDLVYNPEKTRFLENCEKQGARIKNGMDMLQYQAEEAWRIFKGN